jgi:uncharacterized repeat protein (TIGR01451 family)
MFRTLSRVGAALGLTALVLMLAGSVLAVPAVRSDVAQPIEAEAQPQALSIAPNFTIVMSTVVAAGGLNQPTSLANAADGSGRLFALEQAGDIRVIKNGTLLSTPFLDLTSKVTSGGEQGLLGLAFDPNYSTNGIFYVNYTSSDPSQLGNTIIARYQVANPAADVANVINVTPIITIDQPQANHNGGGMQFGPDGYLYIGMGDGGNANDEGAGHAPEGNGQSHSTLLGKILRVNVRGVPTYTIPPTNPFTQTTGYRPEIWALGLRNPWRFSFDRATGDLYIGDVGQNCWEEIDYQPASSHGGENYGWRLEEGFRQFDPNDANNCSMPLSTLVTTTKPITAYNHNFGSAVTGGYVYRGQQYPWMHGVYFYSDSGSGRIWAIQQTSPGVWSGAELLDTSYGVTAFGEDENGELYVTDYNQGRIFKITSPSPVDLSTSSKTASASQVNPGSTVTYTIVLRSTGATFSATVHVTDTVPAGLSYVAGSLAASSGVINAAAAPTLKWSGTMSTTPTSIVTITYRALVTASSAQAITNTAAINPGTGAPFNRSASVAVIGPDLTSSTKSASSGAARFGDVMTYTIVVRNTGGPFPSTVHVTDTLPSDLAYVPGSLTASGGTPDDTAAPMLNWSGVMSATPAITLTFAVSVTTPDTKAIVNTATINSGYGPLLTRTALIVVNPHELFLTLIVRNN